MFVEATVVALWAGEWMVIGLWTFMKAVTVSLSLFVVFPVLIPAVLVSWLRCRMLTASKSLVVSNSIFAHILLALVTSIQ